jgi:hypothetical protein
MFELLRLSMEISMEVFTSWFGWGSMFLGEGGMCWGFGGLWGGLSIGWVSDIFCFFIYVYAGLDGTFLWGIVCCGGGAGFY